MTDYDGRRSNAPAAHANTSHWLPRVLLSIGALVMSVFIMATVGMFWGVDGIGLLILGLLLFCLVGGPILKWYFERQDRA
jgi:hypothetical protein